MKVILDCNILISFLITPGKTIRKIKYFLENDKFDLIISDEIITEIKNVLDRLESRKYFSKYEATRLLKLILRKSNIINVNSVVNACIDKKDNRYLACAKDSRANYLVTDDIHHLLPMKKYKYTRIIAPQDFILILQALPVDKL